MNSTSLIALALLIAAVLGTAGCTGTDTPAAPVSAANPLAGDPAVGTWTGTYHGTETDGLEVTSVYTVTIGENGLGTVSFDRKETKGFSHRTSTYAMDGTVDKNGSVYTIEAQILGTYTLTLADDGSATLTAPNVQAGIPLTKSGA